MLKYILFIFLIVVLTIKGYAQNLFAKPLSVTAIYDDPDFKFYYPSKIKLSQNNIRIVDAKDTSQREIINFKIIDSLEQGMENAPDYMVGFKVTHPLIDSSTAEATAKFFYSKTKKEGTLKIEYLNSKNVNKNFDFIINE